MQLIFTMILVWLGVQSAPTHNSRIACARGLSARNTTADLADIILGDQSFLRIRECDAMFRAFVSLEKKQSIPWWSHAEQSQLEMPEFFNVSRWPEVQPYESEGLRLNLEFNDLSGVLALDELPPRVEDLSLDGNKGLDVKLSGAMVKELSLKHCNLSFFDFPALRGSAVKTLSLRGNPIQSGDLAVLNGTAVKRLYLSDTLSTKEDTDWSRLARMRVQGDIRLNRVVFDWSGSEMNWDHHSQSFHV